MKYELDARFDSCKSFYGKAEVEEDGDELLLYSYGTLAAKYNKVTREPTVYNLQSMTTTRHVREFFRQQGFESKTKSELMKWCS